MKNERRSKAARLHRNRYRCAQPTLREGSVLVTVLVVIVLLTFSAVVYVSRATTEARASAGTLRRLRAELAMDSEIEVVAARIDREMRQIQSNGGSSDTPSKFVHDGETDGLVLHISTEQGAFRFQSGLRDESSCINLNAIPTDGTDLEQERNWLLPLPGMTPQIADAILDWLDADDSPRPLGAEVSYYTAQSPGLRPANGPLAHLNELLQVRGVTAELLYGADTNRDGWLQASERRAFESFANSTGPFGWSAWLTLDSRESNLDATGALRIDLNQPSLPQLYTALRSRLGPREAFFIVAYRLFGSLEIEQDRIDQFLRQKELRKQRRGGAVANSNGRSTPPVGQSPLEEAIERNDPPFPLEEDDETELIIDGVNLSVPPAYRIRSLLDLIGVAVRVQSGGVDAIVDSPWSADPHSVARAYRLLNVSCTTVPGEAVAGRINVLTAPSIVMQSVPEIDRPLADRIVTVRKRWSARDGIELTWLYESGVMSLAELRRTAPFLTSQGDVMTGIALGVSPGGPVVASRIVVDATSKPAQVATRNRIDEIAVADWLMIVQSLEKN